MAERRWNQRPPERGLEGERARAIAEKLLSIEHHARCYSRQGGECDCYQRDRAEFVLSRAFLALLDQLAEAERREERLREVIHSLPHKHSCRYYGSRPCDCGRNAALLADSEGGSGG